LPNSYFAVKAPADRTPETIRLRGPWALPEVIRIGTSLPGWASGRIKIRGAVGIPTGSLLRCRASRPAIL